MFMRFLDLELSDKVPDSKTIWLFKETVTRSGKTEELFHTFEELLEKEGYIGKEGKITDASVHDSTPVTDIMEEKDADQELYGDSAYTGPTVEAAILKNKMKNCTHEKGYRNKPLTEEQKKNNGRKSSVRVRIEHIFGFVENSTHGSYIRCIGRIRAESQIGLMNLIYNLFRYIQLQKTGYGG